MSDTAVKVDVYLADLGRLVGLTGQENAKPLLKCVFVAGLPADTAVHLKSIAVVKKSTLSELVKVCCHRDSNGAVSHLQDRHTNHYTTAAYTAQHILRKSNFFGALVVICPCEKKSFFVRRTISRDVGISFAI